MKRVIISALLILLLVPIASAGLFDWFTGKAATNSLSDQQQSEWVSQGTPIKITINNQEHELNIIDVTDSKDTCGVSVDGYFAWIKTGEDEKVNGILIGIKDAQTSTGTAQDVDRCLITFSGSPLTKTDVTSDNAPTTAVTDSASATKAGTQAPINTNLCVEAIPGHNNLNENRINVVFVGINYNELAYLEGKGQVLRPVSNKDSFIAYVKEIIDADQKSMFGILSVEPFKSNKDRFNFWYVDEIGRVESFQEGAFQVNEYYGSEANNEIERLRSMCPSNNEQVIALIDWAFRSNADIFWRIIKISLLDGNPNNLTEKRLQKYEKTPIHELAHSFGKLSDEYTPGSILFTGKQSTMVGNVGNHCFYSADVSCIQGVDYPFNFCNSTTTSVEDCEKNAEWKDLIGNGCGQDGIVDCTKPTCTKSEVTNEFSCSGDSDYNLEISCKNLGCSYTNTYRSSPMNIMGFNDLEDHGTIGAFYDSDTSRSFGPNNERAICRMIKNQTGFAGGICNQLCLDGCPDGQRCIKGACQSLGSNKTIPKNDTSCICPAVYAPVCGIDGKTYSNSCEAKCSNVNIKSQGECPKSVTKCDGCLNEKSQCLPYGTRVSNSYCSLDKILIAQKASNQICKNNFECISNLCINDKCVSKSLWDRILRFFTRFL